MKLNNKKKEKLFLRQHRTRTIEVSSWIYRKTATNKTGDRSCYASSFALEELSSCLLNFVFDIEILKVRRGGGEGAFVRRFNEQSVEKRGKGSSSLIDNSRIQSTRASYGSGGVMVRPVLGLCVVRQRSQLVSAQIVHDPGSKRVAHYVHRRPAAIPADSKTENCFVQICLKEKLT